MHDTPLKNLFGDDFRFHSSGCVRVQNVRALVVWLLDETKGWSAGDIDRVIKSGQQKTASLGKPVPLHWVYVTAWRSSARTFTAMMGSAGLPFRPPQSFDRLRRTALDP